eukprot:TRINITY_DN261_c0_g1_i1.p1 TRINITY_DN261_c0_g1~~TRINITY_DN261_c0_g1_i1.p1  ORF type:complete len:603 (-),score=129.81 TRINITY_DN261_c0_g1_i1:767-2575(-)
MPNGGYTLSIECILKEAKFRWLKGYEVLTILQNYQSYGLQLSTAAPVDPQSGSLFLFNKRLVKFRKDGVNWKKQKDGKTVRESHEKLKVGGVKVLSCCYTRSSDNTAFQRRIYWLLEGDLTTVLVHYLLLEKDSNSFHDDEARGLPMHAYHHDSHEEKETSAASSGEHSEEEERSLPEYNVFSCPPPSNSAANNLNEPLMDFVNSLMTPELPLRNNPLPPINFQHNNHVMERPNERNVVEMPNPLPSPPCLGRLAKVTDFSPEWDYVDGGAKVIITGPDFKRGISYFCMFDQMEVPAEVVQDGVLRCRVPAHSGTGVVTFCVTRGNFVLYSEVKHFEFRKRESTSEQGLLLNERSFKLRIIERLERLERETNSTTASSSFTLSPTMLESLGKTLEDKFLSEDQLEQILTKILQNLMEVIDNKEAINSQDKDGFTLLHCACALRYQMLASTLIQWGVNVNIQDSTGNTAFHWAMKNRDQKMIKLLLDYVDLNKSAYTQLDFQSKNQPQRPQHENRFQMDNQSKMNPVSTPINHNSMPRHEAAVPIQSFLWNKISVRTRSENEAAKMIQLAFKDYKTRRMQQNVEESQKRGHEARLNRVTEKRK